MRLPNDSVRILFVADGGSVDDTIVDIDGDDRFDVDVVSDPQECLEHLDDGVIAGRDCIVLAVDSITAEHSTLLEALQERRVTVPVFALVDRPSDEEVAKMLDCGVVDVLPGTGSARTRVATNRLLRAVQADVDRTDQRTSIQDRERELQRQNERIAALHEVATEMKSTTNRDGIYDLVIEAVEEILEFDICIIDELEDGVLVPKAVGSGMSLEDYFEETPVDESGNLGAETYREGTTLVVSDLHEAGYAPAKYEFTSAISVPLDDRGIFQAVAEEADAFDQSDRRLVELLVEHAVAAVDRLERERELQTRAATLERQNERLDRFASIVSHDLRNPLSVARGRLQLAATECDSAHLEDVDHAHERMRTLIDDILELARAGQAVADLDEVALREAVQSCWQHVETEDATIRIDTDARVLADASRLQQLFENIVRNAVEHGPTEASSSAQASDGDLVSITVGAFEDGFYVEDDGTGIPEEHRETVFESGYSTGKEGTGFGLNIVQEIADAHDWTVRVTESSYGGARFEIRGVSFVDA